MIATDLLNGARKHFGMVLHRLSWSGQTISFSNLMSICTIHFERILDTVIETLESGMLNLAGGVFNEASTEHTNS